MTNMYILKNMEKVFGEHMDLMCQNKYFLTNGLTALEMACVGTPPIEAFCSSLKQETASKEDYDHAINVHELFRCSNWKD